MRFGIWTPLPHVIRQEQRMEDALAEHRSGDMRGLRDPAFDFAVDIVRKAESYGFANTLVAQRYLGPDLEAWSLASALAPLTKTIEIHARRRKPCGLALPGAETRRSRRRWRARARPSESPKP